MLTYLIRRRWFEYFYHTRNRRSRSIPAGALEEIRRLRNQGATLRGLAVALNRATFRTRRGTPWRLESVARVVKKTIVR